jgi:hypothetical protein
VLVLGHTAREVGHYRRNWNTGTSVVSGTPCRSAASADGVGWGAPGRVLRAALSSPITRGGLSAGWPRSRILP